jgi:hypothetical protein
MNEDERPEIELAREVVVALAPAELPLFPAMQRAFDADPKGRGIRTGAGDDILGFGLSDVATLLTPVALIAAKQAVSFMALEIGKGHAKDAATDISSRVRRLIRRDPDRQALDPALLAQVHSIAETVALKSKLPKTRAAALADAIVERLGPK